MALRLVAPQFKLMTSMGGATGVGSATSIFSGPPVPQSAPFGPQSFCVSMALKSSRS